MTSVFVCEWSGNIFFILRLTWKSCKKKHRVWLEFNQSRELTVLFILYFWQTVLGLPFQNIKGLFFIHTIFSHPHSHILSFICFPSQPARVHYQRRPPPPVGRPRPPILPRRTDLYSTPTWDCTQREQPTCISAQGNNYWQITAGESSGVCH